MSNEDCFGVNVDNEVDAEDLELINQNSSDSVESKVE